MHMILPSRAKHLIPEFGRLQEDIYHRHFLLVSCELRELSQLNMSYYYEQARSYFKNLIHHGFFNSSLYIYDVKMFQVITTSSPITVSDGNDILSNRNTGYVYNNDGQAGVAGNATTLINWSGRFANNQSISSTVASISSSTTITNSQIFELTDVVTITGAGGFTASVSEPLNLNPELINTVSIVFSL